MYKLLVWLFPSILTLATLAILSWGPSWNLPLWGLLLICFVVFYLSLTAGMALVSIQGPWCEVGTFAIDSGAKTFYLPIKNGDVRARIRVSIDSAMDSWESVEHLSHSVEAFWWERSKPYDAILQPGGRERSILLAADHHARPSGHPSLFVLGKEGPSPVSRDVPLNEQGIITLTVGITCETLPTSKKSKVEVSKLPPLTLSVAPDLDNSEVGYKIVLS